MAAHHRRRLVRRFTAGLSALLLTAGIAGPPTAQADPAHHRTAVGTGWVIGYGPALVERTAAEDLAQRLRADFGQTLPTVPLPAPVTGPGATGRSVAALHQLYRQLRAAAGLIVVGTPGDNLVGAVADRLHRFRVELSHPESYQMQLRRLGPLPILFLTGATAKGAMDAAFRFEDRHSLDVTGLDRTGAPAFVNRVAGHLFTQSPPPDWTADEQASYYAHNYLNVVWGEKYGPPLPAAERAKWGLGLALEMRLPPVSAAWLADPANASAIYHRTIGGATHTVIDPFDPAGAQAFRDAFEQAVADNPDLAILYVIFGDYSYAIDGTSTRVSDGARCDCTLSSAALEVMRILKGVLAGTSIQPAAWLWHLYPSGGDQAFMLKLKDLGVGMIYNEDGNGDDWFSRRSNFNAAALASGPDGRTVYGPQYSVVVSASGDCESADPAIGLPTPQVAETKLRALADHGIDNFFLWWGGAEGWTYSANMSVIRKMIWDPDAYDPGNPHPFDPRDPDPLLWAVAREDFGPMAADVLRYWGAVDAAIVNPAPDGAPGGVPVADWYQRLGVFTLPAVFGGGANVPLTPTALANPSRFRIYAGWGTAPATLAGFGAVVSALAGVNALGAELDAGTSTAFTQMRRWVEIYSDLFTSQYDLLRALAVADAHRAPDGTLDVDDPALRTDLEPLTRAEIANSQDLAAAFAQLPANANLYGSSRTAFEGTGHRDKDLMALQAKIASMQIWLDGLRNVARDATATASSWKDDTRLPENAVDGNLGTLWHSKYADDQWLAVDLGAAQAVQVIVVRWNRNAPATHYLVQSADFPDGPWTTLADVSAPSGGDDAISLTAPVTTRYLRVFGLTRGSPYGFAINEFEAYAPAPAGT